MTGHASKYQQILMLFVLPFIKFHKGSEMVHYYIGILYASGADAPGLNPNMRRLCSDHSVTGHTRSSVCHFFRRFRILYELSFKTCAILLTHDNGKSS